MKRSLLFRSFLIALILSAFTLIVPVSAQGVSFDMLTEATLPWDAVPSPDGSTIYYTALQSSGTPAVFSIPAAGGDPTVLASGAPFVMPLGLDISADGKTLYVADPWMAGAAGNAIFAVSTAGNAAPTVVAGTQGTAPQGVTVAGDQLYFSGINPANAGQAAIYQIALSGAGDATLVAQGTRLIAPSGLAVAKDGTVYVLDRLASGNGLGAVLRMKDGTVDAIASDVRIGGQMAGIALTMDESTLLVSSLDKTEGTAQVLAINLSTMQTSIINDVIKANKGAGGLHRAHDANTFAWADSSYSLSSPDTSIQKPGHVYIVHA
jgi:DNA-binding beta-propeller fold protein YncE